MLENETPVVFIDKKALLTESGLNYDSTQNARLNKLHYLNKYYFIKIIFRVSTRFPAFS
jgi:hypothetical protein